MRIGALWFAPLLAAVFLTPPAPPAAAVVPACDAVEHQQFDFWLGDWDAFEGDAPTKPVARNRVTRMVGGCAIREVYEQNDGLVGESFSTYDASRKVWHQSWVTNRGQLLLLEGTFTNGRMVLQGAMPSNDGHPAVIRGTWWREGDAVREVAESSSDGGKTWRPVFDITFRRHAPP